MLLTGEVVRGLFAKFSGEHRFVLEMRWVGDLCDPGGRGHDEGPVLGNGNDKTDEPL